ncbi:MAG: hypothetical protein LBI06_08865, partial [Treponema sp.]|nr:hypothetical protein [Treponema sp.]
AVALYGLLGDIIIQILYITYVAFSLVGTINFWDLFLTRLKKQEDELDYICERYIQFFNATVFSILTVLLSLFVTMTWLNLDATCSYISLATFMCVLLILNMLHSHELTFMPKIILCNDKEDNVISGFKKLKIGRMNKKDTDKIVDTIIKEFKYVFEYIFDTSDEVTLKRTLRSLVTSCFGFGFLGYMNFYSIKRSDDNREIGLIKMSTLHRCLIYSFLELLFIPIIIISQFGAGKLWQIKKRSTEIKKSQPQLQNKTEFELTYFVIYEEFRKNKYATCAADLLVKALFYSKTNNINCSRLILLVREFNHSALALFKTIGFEEYVSEKCITEPIEITSKQGKGIFFQYSKESVSAPSIKDSIM